MIGIFDSGSGGLTVLSALKQYAPHADVVYFGDIKHAPYGNRSREELGALLVLGFERLLDRGATRIIAACNSVSASVAEPLIHFVGLSKSDVIEMVEPTVERLAAERMSRIVLVATKATIESGLYQRQCDRVGIEVVPVAIPQLAGAIEQDVPFDAQAAYIVAALRSIRVPADALVLGCTHFPFARSAFETVLAARNLEMPVIDPADFVAQGAIERFGISGGGGSIRFVISADSVPFRQKVSQLFSGFPYTIEFAREP
jgi:glutamate racemase